MFYGPHYACTVVHCTDYHSLLITTHQLQTIKTYCTSCCRHSTIFSATTCLFSHAIPASACGNTKTGTHELRKLTRSIFDLSDFDDSLLSR